MGRGFGGALYRWLDEAVFSCEVSNNLIEYSFQFNSLAHRSIVYEE